MSLTLLIWFLTFAVTACLSLWRPAWAVALYMLTFFLSPPFWWWGDDIAHIRWNFYTSLVLLGSVVIHGAFMDPMFIRRRLSKRFVYIALLVVANATAVHFLLAPHRGISFSSYELLLKHMVLFVLLMASIRDELDLKIILIAIVLGATYIGYEATINERGKMSGGRLEGLGIPNAATANDLACLMVSVVPLVAPLFLFGGLRGKALAIIAGPFILNVIILCNSRGAFLALIILGFVYLFASPKQIRGQVYRITALAVLAGWLLMGDPRVIERFMTTFSGSEERDNSAKSRLEYWKAGMMLLKDRPLGSGGDGFKTVYGPYYIEKVTGDPTPRSVHQGYLSVACQWGVQGLLLRLSLLIGGIYVAWRNSRIAIGARRWFLAGVNLSLVAAIVGLMVQSFFGTFLDKEWGLYMIALAVGSSRILLQGPSEDADDHQIVSDPVDDSDADVHPGAVYAAI